MILVMLGTAVASAVLLPATRESSASQKAEGERTSEWTPADARLLNRGFVMLDGRSYYVGEDGVVQKKRIVGSERDGYAVANRDGVCCMSREMRLAAAFMARHCTGDTLKEKLRSGFDYMVKHFPYERSYEHPPTAQDMPALAEDMFTRERGNCYRYAACFAYLAKIVGYRVRVVIGTTAGNPHGWVEILVGKRWLLCDPDAQMAEKHLPDGFCYMMTKHCWQITPEKRCELTLTGDMEIVWS